MALTDENKLVLKNNRNVLKDNLEIIAKFFYQSLFNLDSEMEHLFENTNTQQSGAIQKFIIYAIDNIDNLEPVFEKMKFISEKHVKKGIKPIYYGTFQSVFIDTLSAGLNVDKGNKLIVAISELLDTLIKQFIAYEKVLYAQR